MKRHVAVKKQTVTCECCNKTFYKGDVYYTQRFVSAECDIVSGYTRKLCARCKYKIDDHAIRFNKFKQNCDHPEKFINEIWTYIPGEAVKEPDHCECGLCGRRC